MAGFDVVSGRRQVRRRISLSGQFVAVDDLQTGEENLLLERFDLTEAGRRTVATWPGGTRRRLDLAAGLVADPEVVFLDEPTTGLDPRSRQDVWQVVSALATSGVTLFLTTQYLEEADRLAGNIALLDGGRVVAQGSPAQLKQRVAGHRLDLVLAGALAFAGGRPAPRRPGRPARPPAA